MPDRTQGETYTHGYSEEARQFFGSRTAAREADFFVPHLRPGTRVLDCGSGPGSITVDFASIVAPGEVVGIDIAESQVEAGRELAEARRVDNVRFERASVYELPFPDRSFDAAFANHVIEHLSDPVRALKEVRRVLKPGGVFGMCNDDWDTLLIEPSTPLLRSAIQLFLRVAEHNGADLRRGRHNRRLLREAGFVRTEGYARLTCFGTNEVTRRMANLTPVQFRDPGFVATVVTQGWADEATLDAMVADFAAWGEDPDAYWAQINPAALGWVPEEG
jgi:ubiquinone/menaquinone biosynthesis C-methylase UbiE